MSHETGSTGVPSSDPSPAPSRWLRSLFRVGTSQPLIDQLARSHRTVHPRADLPLLRRAYDVAERVHRGQIRKSGEPFITHPVAVAQILATLGLDTTALVAALLHDTVEDTSYALDQLQAEFGHEVAHLVDGVTKFDKMLFGEAAEAETIRKMILAAGRDVRVLIIKLADRLHNMRTLQFRSRASQVRIARATGDVIVPLADRLGVHIIKRELEDIVFAAVEPDAYAQIDQYLRRQPDRSAYLDNVLGTVRQEMRRARVHGDVEPRARHHFSIWRETTSRGWAVPFDPPRLVISISGPETDCYATLGAVHSTWQPVPGRFKDFIASPKYNLYQSLHTTVIGPGDTPIEVLIRTDEMHRTAELGVVAQLDRAARAEQLAWLRRLLDWQRDAINPADFLNSLRCDLSSTQILVFTTTGQQISLPEDATPVDLAYTLGNGTGDRSIGAYVNGRLVPLSATLEDGDTVELILAAEGGYPGPSREWQEFVRSPEAQIQINQWFAEHAGEASAPITHKIQLGRAAIGLSLRQHNRALANEAPLHQLARHLGYADLDALLVAVADREKCPDDIVEQLIATVDHKRTV